MKNSILLLILFLFAGCDSGMDRVPTADEIRDSSRTKLFLVEAEQIRGIYQNIDVDSVIFAYRTRTASESDFWHFQTNQLVSAGWRELDSIEGTRRFEFVQERTPNQAVGNAEEVRIHYSPEQIIVAWAQADPRDKVNHFSDTHEARFAESVIWPKLKEAITQQSAPPDRR